MERREHPYYIVPLIEALPSAGEEERADLTRRIAAAVGDEAALRRILGIDPPDWAAFYPDMAGGAPDTSDTIDAFISKFSSEKAARIPQVEEIVAAPAVDYASLLAHEEKAPNQEEAAPEEDGTARKQEDGLAAPLLKMMIRERNYVKAMEIIERQSLNNPEKSIYFADQMRFLRKLIKNEELGHRAPSPRQAGEGEGPDI